MEIQNGLCPRCYTVAPSGPAPRRRRPIFLTTESSSALPVVERLGIVASQGVYGVNALTDLGSSVRDLVGGRNIQLEQAISVGRTQVLAEIEDAAKSLDADAVVGLLVEVKELAGGGKSMLLVTATGTAVLLEGPRTAN